MQRFMYVSGSGVAVASLMSFLALLPTTLAVVLLVLIVLVGGLLCYQHRRWDHDFEKHAVDQRADPALIEALRRRRP